MAGQQQKEKTATWQEMYDAVFKQMSTHKVLSKKYTVEQIDIMVKSSLIQKALDKIEFSTSGARRRGAYRKYIKQMSVIGEPNPMEEDEYYEYLGKRVRSQLVKEGFAFALSKDEKEKYTVIADENQKKSIAEKTNLTAEALKKILTS